jgi:hypothetical protein
MIDGNLVALLDAVTVIEEALSTVKPDDSAMEELPIEQWFTPDDLHVSEDDTVASLSGTNNAFTEANETMDRVHSMLTTNSSQLFRKAQACLQKLSQG